MKIAMIGHKRVPSRSGGIEVVVERLSTRMVELSHKVDIYNRHTNENKIKKYKGCKIIEVPTLKNTKFNAMVYSLFATILVCFKKYDVIHYHAEGPCAMLPLAKLFRKRCIATIHGLDWQRSKWGGFATAYLKFGEKMAVKFADEIIVLSKDVQNYFKKEYGRNTIFIPNGIELKERKEVNLINKEYGLEKDEYLLFLARLTPEKGADYLIEAFKNIKTDKKLVIAGQLIPSTQYIDKLKQLASGDDRIIFTGFVEGDKLLELFSNCFLYVLPSDIEGMPMSLLEAIGLNARCVVSDIPENVDIAEKYLHSFKKSDVNSLKNVLENIIYDSKNKPTNFGKCKDEKEVETQLENIIKNYDWDIIVNKTLELYLR